MEPEPALWSHFQVISSTWQRPVSKRGIRSLPLALEVVLLLFLLGIINAIPAGAAPLIFESQLKSETFAGKDSFDDQYNFGKHLRDSGHLAEASKVFQALAARAHVDKDTHRESQALFALSGCQIRQFQYSIALRTLDRARQLAEAFQHDDTLLGAIWGNISVVYSQVGDFAAASRAGEKGVAYLKHSPRRDYFVMSLGNLGETQFGIGQTALGRRSLESAIAAASHEQLPALEATYADILGIWLVLDGDLKAAEVYIRQGLELRKKLGNESQLAVSYEHLAELEQKLGGSFLPDALKNINVALHSHSADLEHTPHYYPIHVRGLIYVGLNKPALALADFKSAVTLADNWRQSALPGDSTNTRTIAQLTAVYKDYVELAAATSLKENDSRLAQNAFEVLARNRSASLREQITRSNRAKLLDSPEYFSLLMQLQAAQAKVTLEGIKGKTDDDRKKLDQLRAELADLENRLGLDQQNQGGLSEKNRHRNSLRDIQARLGVREALLSYSLGTTHSYLWALTNNELKLYELPNQTTMQDQVREFRDAVQFPGKHGRLDVSGRVLSRSLLGPFDSAIMQKPDWLVAADGELLDKMVFAALPFAHDGAAAAPLIVSHSVRILPAALLSGAVPATKTQNVFVGVGDPIYNRADSRWKPSAGTSVLSTKSVARLPGSRKELTDSSKASGLPAIQLLTGPEASGAFLRQATLTSPEIVHFAVHVLSPDGRPGEAALALSLNAQGVPELLTAESVATYHVPGSLVVLSGCASQQGEILPGAGIVGLSRSWLLAGASAVVVSAWPTPDDSGSFFSKFYDHFRQTDGSIPHRAAVALQLAQLDMLHAGGYRSDPSFWGAYSIVSKE